MGLEEHVPSAPAELFSRIVTYILPRHVLPNRYLHDNLGWLLRHYFWSFTVNIVRGARICL